MTAVFSDLIYQIVCMTVNTLDGPGRGSSLGSETHLEFIYAERRCSTGDDHVHQSLPSGLI